MLLERIICFFLTLEYSRPFFTSPFEMKKDLSLNFLDFTSICLSVQGVFSLVHLSGDVLVKNEDTSYPARIFRLATIFSLEFIS